MRLTKITIILLAAFALSMAFQVDAAKLQAPNQLAQVPTKPLVELEQEEEGDVSGEIIVRTAMQFLGVPYRSGKSSPKGFDCSGFTSYVFKQFSIALKRDSRSQYTQGTPIKKVSDLRAGDLVFWKGRNSKSNTVGHVGIVTEVSEETGSFKFVHASTTNGIRVDDSRQAYYTKRYVGARRVLSEEEEPDFSFITH